MIHAADTLREGEFLADYERVEILCKSAPGAVNELVNWGARFHREEDGRLTQRFFGAHTYRRTVFYEDWTGEEIIRVLMDQVRSAENRNYRQCLRHKIIKISWRTWRKPCRRRGKM